MRALILDCDGVLAETERELHLPAFNQTFEEFGLPLRWGDEEYAERLRIAGGKERVAAALGARLMSAAGLRFDAASVAELAARLHARKTEIVAEMLLRNPPPARPGVRRLVSAAHEAGWKLAVASTSAEDTVCRVVEAVAGRLADDVLILAGDVVSRKKPDPEIYELAIARLGASKREAIVIEDSRSGLLAARAAGLSCLVTVSEYTGDDDFSGALLVVSSLGDPDEPLRVIANSSTVSPQRQLTLADLEALVEGGNRAPET